MNDGLYCCIPSPKSSGTSGTIQQLGGVNVMRKASREFESGLLALIPQLRRRALNLSRDPSFADDLVQEALMRAWQNRSRFRMGSNLAAWMMTILRNCFLSDMRRMKRVRIAQERMIPQSAIAPDRADHMMRLRELSGDIASLPPEQRRPLLMVSIDAASYAETADRCGCSVGTVKSRVSRARRRLLEHAGEV